jgi:ATP-binding cassette subfamily B protein
LRALSVLLPYIGRYKLRAFAALGMLLGAAAATLTVPLAIRSMIDVGFSGSDPAFVNRTFGGLLLLAGALAVASSGRYFLVTTLGERIVADLRRDVFAHLVRLSPAFFDTAQSGELVSRLTADTVQIKSAVGASVSIALRNIVLFAGAATMMVVTSPQLSGLILAVIPAVVLPVVAFGRRVRRGARLAQDRLADASAFRRREWSRRAHESSRLPLERSLTGRVFASGVEQAFWAAARETRPRAPILTAGRDLPCVRQSRRQCSGGAPTAGAFGTP